ncbi:MAG: CGNR zinc finger domain-containing protein [Christensenellales bacterium]
MSKNILDKNSDDFFKLSTNFFSMEGCKCHLDIDTYTVSPKNIEYKYKVKADKENTLHYAFSGKNGLCITTPMGSIRKENLLNELISLPIGDVNAIIEFFEDNGFLFPLPNDNYINIDVDSLFAFIYRIKSAVLLLSELETPKRNYRSILNYAFYLLLANQATFTIGKKQYSTYKHNLLGFFENISSFPEIDGSKEEFNKDTYSVKDMIYGPIYELNIEEYKDVTLKNHTIEKYPGVYNFRYQNIMYLYRNAISLDKKDRLIVEFLFHFMNKVGIIESISFERGVAFHAKPNIDKFDKKLKETLEIIAKIVLNEEINANLRGIYPRFNPIDMTPTWKATNMLSALYFSIFYMRPGSEIYRACANVACNNYFVVKTSNSRKKYCCPNCRNATAQRNFRKKQNAK